MDLLRLQMCGSPAELLNNPGDLCDSLVSGVCEMARRLSSPVEWNKTEAAGGTKGDVEAGVEILIGIANGRTVRTTSRYHSMTGTESDREQIYACADNRTTERQTEPLRQRV